MINKTTYVICDRCKIKKELSGDIDNQHNDYKFYHFHHITNKSDTEGWCDYDLCDDCYKKFKDFMKGFST